MLRHVMHTQPEEARNGIWEVTTWSPKNDKNEIVSSSKLENHWIMYSLNQLDRERETTPKLIIISQEMSASLWREREREQVFERRPLICAKLITH